MFYTLALLLVQATPSATTQLTPSPAPSKPVSRQVDPGVLDDNDQTFHVGKVGNWAIRIDRTLGFGCYAFAYYEDGTILRVMASPADNEIFIGLANSRWRSLQPDQVYPVEIQFGGYDPWIGNAAVTALTPTLKMLSLSIDGKFIEELSNSWYLEARYEDRPLARLRLDGSNEMLDSLATCQDAVEEYVDDPFN